MTHDDSRRAEPPKSAPRGAGLPHKWACAKCHQWRYSCEGRSVYRLRGLWQCAECKKG